MGFFQKAGEQAHQLFTKIANTPHLVRKIDNSVALVAHFVGNTANAFGVPAVSNIATQVANGVHTVRNNLEKSINTPMNAIRN